MVLAVQVLFGQSWDRETPRLKWERQPLSAQEAQQLLAHVCAAGVESTTVGNERAFRCYSPPAQEGSRTGKTVPLRRLNPSELVSSRPAAAQEQISFHWVSTVTYGHFLGPSSEDAALSGWAGETHPSFWGGTLLLTKKNGEWQPVWYKHAIITRHCQKLKARSGRDVLLCEEEDGGNGHSFHILYVLDLTGPKSPWDSAVFIANSYLALCRDQQLQAIERIVFRDAADGTSPFITVFARHGRRKLSEEETEQCADDRLRSLPAAREYRIDFVLRDSLIATPRSSAVAALFKGR
jgi:hypothetical protein